MFKFLYKIVLCCTFLALAIFLSYVISYPNPGSSIFDTLLPNLNYPIWLKSITVFGFVYNIKDNFRFLLTALAVYVGLKTLYRSFFKSLYSELYTIHVYLKLKIVKIYKNCKKFSSYVSKKKNKFETVSGTPEQEIFDNNKTCVLLDGPWGSGKTFYYERHIRPKLDTKVIYISCFSATREQLISQLIISTITYNIISLHGFLNTFILNSWQSFMPKHAVIVFDDLERLHINSPNNYADLIAIVDFLKVQNKCKIILICNREEIPGNIFNKYLEKVVDNEITDFVPESNISSALKTVAVKLKISKIQGEIENIVETTFRELKYYNLRLIKIAYRDICHNFSQFLDNHTTDHINSATQEIISAFIKSINTYIKLIIKLNNLYYKDHKLYTDLFNYCNHDINFPFTIDIEKEDVTKNKEKQLAELKQNRNLGSIDPSDLKNQIPKNNVIENMIKSITFFNFLYTNYLCLYFHKNITNKIKVIIKLYQGYLNNKNYSQISDLLNIPEYRNIIIDDLKIADKESPHNLILNKMDKILDSIDFNLFTEEENKLIIDRKNDLLNSKLLDNSILNNSIDFPHLNTIELGTILIKLNKYDMLETLINMRLKIQDVPLTYTNFESIDGAFIWFYEKNISIAAMLKNMKQHNDKFLSTLFKIAADKYKEPALTIEKKLQLLLTISTLIISNEMNNIQLVNINEMNILIEIDKLLQTNNKFTNSSNLQGLMFNYILLRKLDNKDKKIPLTTLNFIKSNYQHDLKYYIGIEESDKWFWSQYKYV